MVSEHPISGVEVGLEDGGGEDDGGVAVGVDHAFDALDKDVLFVDVCVDECELGVGGDTGGYCAEVGE